MEEASTTGCMSQLRPAVRIPRRKGSGILQKRLGGMMRYAVFNASGLLGLQLGGVGLDKGHSFPVHELHCHGPSA